MWLCYLIACLPMIFGAVMWIRKSEITFGEWALAAVAGFLVALICHVSALYGMTADTETWSGHVLDAMHHPWWRAEWTETETYTDSKGNTKTRTVHKSEEHSEYWSYDASFGQGRETIEISASTFDSVLRNFGGRIRTTLQGQFRTGRPQRVCGGQCDELLLPGAQKHEVQQPDQGRT